jgi:hypothetical protein
MGLPDQCRIEEKTFNTKDTTSTKERKKKIFYRKNQETTQEMHQVLDLSELCGLIALANFDSVVEKRFLKLNY